MSLSPEEITSLQNKLIQRLESDIYVLESKISTVQAQLDTLEKEKRKKNNHLFNIHDARRKLQEEKWNKQLKENAANMKKHPKKEFEFEIDNSMILSVPSKPDDNLIYKPNPENKPRDDQIKSRRLRMELTESSAHSQIKEVNGLHAVVSECYEFGDNNDVCVIILGEVPVVIICKFSYPFSSPEIYIIVGPEVMIEFRHYIGLKRPDFPYKELEWAQSMNLGDVYKYVVYTIAEAREFIEIKF
jgi:hypothetical protein